MKCKFVISALTFFVSVAGLAQKNEIKEAQNHFNNGKPTEALAILKATEYMIVNAKDEEKSEFYNLKGKVLVGLAEKNIESAKNYSLAVSAYQELIAEETASGSFKYAVQAKAAIKEVRSGLSRSALADVGNNKLIDGAHKMYSLYQMEKKDTLNLFFSASYFLEAKEYDLALKGYKELASLKYTGKGMEFFAVNKKTGSEEMFITVSARDSGIKAATHEKPTNVMAKSKRTDIHKKIAFIYTQKGDLNSAEEYYKKILEFSPLDIDTYIDLAYLKLDKKKLLVDEMSALGTSPKDMKIYDELKLKKDEVLKSAVSYLEKGDRVVPKNAEVVKLLLNLYRALDMMTEYNALKART
jgi:tetratricopeptide (TPR) repeat protein